MNNEHPHNPTKLSFGRKALILMDICRIDRPKISMCCSITRPFLDSYPRTLCSEQEKYSRSYDMNTIFFRSDCLYVATHSKAAAFVVMEDAVMFWKRGGRSLAEISFLKIAYYT